MAKKNQTTVDTPGVKKTPKTSITLARKARKVLQSNGLHYFKEWAEKPTTGGRRPKGARVSFKADNPKLYSQLVKKGEALNRRMDRGPKPKKQPEQPDEQD